MHYTRDYSAMSENAALVAALDDIVEYMGGPDKFRKWADGMRESGIVAPTLPWFAGAMDMFAGITGEWPIRALYQYVWPAAVEPTSRPIWTMVSAKVIDQLGFLPAWLSHSDPRPAAQQFHANYQHGGGWRPQEGWAFVVNDGPDGEPIWPSARLLYPQDPPLKPLAWCQLRTETVLLFPHGIVCIVQPAHEGAARAFEVCRMD